MKVYLDENLPASIARALNELQTHYSSDGLTVLHISDEFARGTRDEVWIKALGAQGAVVITQDRNIQRIRSQRDLIRECGAGVIFLKPPSKSGLPYWEQVTAIIGAWQKIRTLALNETTPYSYELVPKGKVLRCLD